MIINEICSAKIIKLSALDFVSLKFVAQCRWYSVRVLIWFSQFYKLPLRYLRISLWAVKLFVSQSFLTLIGLTTSLEDNEAIFTFWDVVIRHAFISFVFLLYVGTVHLFCWFQVREEMLAERSKRLEEHHEKLGAIIAKLQIEKAQQVCISCDGYMKLLLVCFSPVFKTCRSVLNIWNLTHIRRQAETIPMRKCVHI